MTKNDIPRAPLGRHQIAAAAPRRRHSRTTVAPPCGPRSGAVSSASGRRRPGHRAPKGATARPTSRCKSRAAAAELSHLAEDRPAAPRSTRPIERRPGHDTARGFALYESLTTVTPLARRSTLHAHRRRTRRLEPGGDLVQRQCPARAPSAAAARALLDVVDAGEAESTCGTGARRRCRVRSATPSSLDRGDVAAPRPRGRRRTRCAARRNRAATRTTHSSSDVDARWSPSAPSRANSSPLAAATPSRLPDPRDAPAPTLVITPTSGRGDLGQPGNLAGRFIPISSTATTSLPAQPQQGQRQTDQVVLVALRLQYGTAGSRKVGVLADRRDHLLGGRLAVAAGDGHHPPGPDRVAASTRRDRRAPAVASTTTKHAASSTPSADALRPAPPPAPLRQTPRRRSRARRDAHRAARRTAIAPERAVSRSRPTRRSASAERRPRCHLAPVAARISCPLQRMSSTAISVANAAVIYPSIEKVSVNVPSGSGAPAGGSCATT